MTRPNVKPVQPFITPSGGASDTAKRRHGFTLVELLVVIGIIVVLIAMVVMGIRHTSQMALRHETETELKVCEDLLSEYKAVNGLKNIEGPDTSVVPTMTLNLPYPPWLNHSYKVPIYIYSTATPPTHVMETHGEQPQTELGVQDFAGPNSPPQPVDAGDLSDRTLGNNPRWGCAAVYNTQGVMFLLLKDPKNRAVVSAMPAKRILETWAPFAKGDKPQPPFTIDAAVLLDGWENPIIFVPRGGMHVWMNPKGTGPDTPWDYKEYIIRSSGTYLKGTEPPIGPNDHAFFASAGPNNYFTDATEKTDRASDNMYSFQSQ